ncbi:MAG: hypothetical protein KME08_14200 [Aphanothece sp. CMT-3BRIN-NPC111]|jgi:hypothetical protein|nr:hypothetical protein [Aphanothece sp. CMT-3BRIN-NPC111]
MEIKKDDYRVCYDQPTATIYCQGSLRLSGMNEYAPIVELLNNVAEQEPPVITLNLTDLEFLNSSGISLISKFVIQVRQKQTINMIVKGSNNIPWQKKSLKNLQRLMPSLILEWE